MITVTVSLEDDLANALQNLTTRTRMTQEEIIKRALTHYVKPIDLDDPLIGLFDLGDPHLAERAEDILRATIKQHSGWTNKE